MKSLEYYEAAIKKTREYPVDAISAGTFFRYNKDITSIVMTNWVERVEDTAFMYSTMISIIIPNTVTYLGQQAFKDSSLESIVIPTSIVIIKKFLCAGCLSLVSVGIPPSVTSIQGSAFSKCSKLSDITIPMFATVSPTAFLGCTKLEDKSNSYNMSLVEYYRDFYHQRIKERVTVLKSLLVYLHGLFLKVEIIFIMIFSRM